MTDPADTAEDHSARIAALEEHIAHQDRTIAELSDQIAGQWKVVEQMRAKLDQLAERFLALEENALEAPPVTRPPHY